MRKMKKVFPGRPVSRIISILISHFVRAVLPDMNEVGRSEPYGGKRQS